jgi:hypothetical protein
MDLKELISRLGVALGIGLATTAIAGMLTFALGAYG